MTGDGGVRAAVLRFCRVLGLLAGCAAYDAVISPSSSGHVPFPRLTAPCFAPPPPLPCVLSPFPCWPVPWCRGCSSCLVSRLPPSLCLPLSALCVCIVLSALCWCLVA